MKKKIFKIFIISLIIALGLEVTLFNFKFYRSLFYPKTIKYSVNQGVDKNVIISNSVTVNLMQNNEVELTDINKKVYNMYIEGTSKEPTHIKIRFRDEGNDEYYDASSMEYMDNIVQSKYINIHPMGKLKSIRLIATTTDDIYIKNIYFNVRTPYNFNVVRIFLVLIICLIYFTFKEFTLFNKKYNMYFPFTVLSIGLIIMGMYFFVHCSNYGKFIYDLKHPNQHHQYQLLARSLAKGKFTIDLKVSDKLKALKNPYDISVRDKQLITNTDYFLDYAYYNGKYYSYFGIVPCLFMHLPYYLVTHNDLNNSLALTYTCAFYLLAAFYLVYHIFERYFPNAKYKEYFISALSVSLLSGISLVIRKGFFYGIPIAFGAALAMLALAFWLRAARDDEKINAKYLMIGSIMMALVVGCRPQIFAAVFLGIPIFWKYIKKKETYSLKNILALALPMLIIGVLIMYYNYARFGSVFDFGANYNLTSNDMTKRGFYFDRTISGLFAFLFELPRLNVVFPFIHAYNIESNYIGMTIYETMVGGMIVINLLSFINLFIFKVKKFINNKEIFYICLGSIIISLVIIVADVEMAGILPRYMCDFGFLLSLSAVMLWMSILTNYKGDTHLIFKILAWLLVLGIVYNTLVFFTDGFISFGYNTYQKIFYYFYYLVSFGV